MRGSRPGNRSARIRDLLAKGFAPQAIARILECSVNSVHVARYYMKNPQRERRGARRRAKITPEKPEAPTPPITVGAIDGHLKALRATIPGGYEDVPNARPVDWNRALVWMRQNPPPALQSISSGGGRIALSYSRRAFFAP